MGKMPGSSGVVPRGGSDRAGKVVCPHCWHQFEVEKILAITQHPDLLGDPVLGPEAPQRFLPSRFTPDGHAIDAYGVVCPDLACPRCHLAIPISLTHKPPLFFSIIGAPGSGKSYLLTTMVWQLRALMPRRFAFAFSDADATSNNIVNEYERTLFLRADKDAPTALEKTEMRGRMYDRVFLHNMEMALPRPLMFSLQPQAHHPSYSAMKDSLNQTLVLYDNAGEHFQPGADSAANPGTQHMVRSRGIFFLFDPSKDPRFRAHCKSRDPQMKGHAQVERQEILLSESIARIKRHSDSAGRLNLDRPIIVVVTKYDIWRALLRHPLPNPWRQSPHFTTSVLDMDAIGVTSFEVRRLLMRFCPELVATAEAFSSNVVYLPVSALGHSPTERRDPNDPNIRLLVVRPKNIRPIWSVVPVLQMLSYFGMILAMKRKKNDKLPVASDCRLSGKLVALTVPGTKQRLAVPTSYLGRLLRCPETGVWFWVPTAEEIGRATTATE